MSYDGLVYYIIFRKWLGTSAVFNITNIIHNHGNFCVMKIKYIMYNVQDYRVLYNKAVSPVIFEGWHFTYMWNLLA